MNILRKLFDGNEREVAKFRLVADKINALEPDFEKIPTEQLAEKTLEFKRRIAERTVDLKERWEEARQIAYGEDATADQYGLTIARVSSLIYGLDNADLRHAGVMRAEAMEYCDTHYATMTDKDWAVITDKLTSAYGMLKRAVAAAQ